MFQAEDAFRPAPYLRNGNVQTILASGPFRAWGKNPMGNTAREIILETEEGIRLVGYYSGRQSNPAKGVVILLHGWEGSAESTYITRTGNALYQRNYDIFRLNFRDHGESHHLNPGIFFAVLLDEVFQAVHQICRLAKGQPVFVVGFSLGGNFALRIARKMLQIPLSNLCHIVGISPVLDPAKSTDRADQSTLIRRYFLKKWRRSLSIKQKMYPNVYNFSKILDLRTIQAITDHLLEEYSDYASAEAYFRAYSILNGALKDLQVSTTIITAKDDPIIPVEDFYRLEINDSTNLVIQTYGGHNGFIDGFFLKSWYEQKLADTFDEIVMAS